MSAFNRARFNLARYNVEVSGQIWLAGASAVTFDFSFAGQTYYGRGNSSVRFLADNLQLDKGRVFSGSAAETFSQTTNINGYCRLAANGSVTFDKELNLSQVIRTAGDAVESVDAQLNLSQEVYIVAHGRESLDMELNLSQIVWTAADAGEVFSSAADVIALTEYVCEFPDLILRPGQTLVIDAGTYNVLLDGQNAIHLQSGEWLDNLNRNTQSIVISGTGATRLTAEILYTERYL